MGHSLRGAAIDLIQTTTGVPMVSPPRPRDRQHGGIKIAGKHYAAKTLPSSKARDNAFAGCGGHELWAAGGGIHERIITSDDAPDFVPVTAGQLQWEHRKNGTHALYVKQTMTLGSAIAVLRESGIETTSDLVARLNDEGLHEQLAQAWEAREALTPMLADTAMLTGYLDPEVDRIISPYVAEAIGTEPGTTPPARVIDVLTDVAARFDSKILPLEFAILRFVRG